MVAIIDDDALVRSSIASLLRSLGLTAVSFESADAFLQQRDGQDVDCLISDIQMPGTSGLQLQRQLALEVAPPPMIAMTAYPTARVRTQILEAGAVCFIEKPIDGDRLISCLETVLGKLPG